MLHLQHPTKRLVFKEVHWIITNYLIIISVASFYNKPPFILMFLFLLRSSVCFTNMLNINLYEVVYLIIQICRKLVWLSGVCCRLNLIKSTDVTHASFRLKIFIIKHLMLSTIFVDAQYEKNNPLKMILFYILHLDFLVLRFFSWDF